MPTLQSRPASGPSSQDCRVANISASQPLSNTYFPRYQAMIDPAIKSLSFDAAGTLIHLREPVGVSYAAVAARHRVIVSSERLDQAFRSVWKRTPLPFSSDTDEADPHERAWWSRLVRSVFSESGATFNSARHFDEFFTDLYDHFESPGTWLLDPAAPALLEAAANRYRLIVLSNFDHRLRRILRDLEVLDFFEHVILSCEQRCSKPDPRLFAHAATTLGLSPTQILHLGDDPICDWQGAQAAGFDHFRVGHRGPQTTDQGQAPLSAFFDQLSLARPD